MRQSSQKAVDSDPNFHEAFIWMIAIDFHMSSETREVLLRTASLGHVEVDNIFDVLNKNTRKHHQLDALRSLVGSH
jgi:hypothetical protein